VVLNCPYELVLYVLLQKFPGYTRETLEAEDARLVQRWIIALEEEAKEAKSPRRRH
jgi:hypothetical protein